MNAPVPWSKYTTVMQLGFRCDGPLQYGRAYTTSTHLATALNYGSDWLETYSYTFDGSGRISQMTRVVNNTSSGGGTDTLRYNYFYNY